MPDHTATARAAAGVREAWLLSDPRGRAALRRAITTNTTSAARPTEEQVIDAMRRVIDEPVRPRLYPYDLAALAAPAVGLERRLLDELPAEVPLTLGTPYHPLWRCTHPERLRRQRPGVDTDGGPRRGWTCGLCERPVCGDPEHRHGGDCDTYRLIAEYASCGRPHVADDVPVTCQGPIGHDGAHRAIDDLGFYTWAYREEALGALA